MRNARTLAGVHTHTHTHTSNSIKETIRCRDTFIFDMKKTSYIW